MSMARIVDAGAVRMRCQFGYSLRVTLAAIRTNRTDRCEGCAASGRGRRHPAGCSDATHVVEPSEIAPAEIEHRELSRAAAARRRASHQHPVARICRTADALAVGKLQRGARL